MWTRPKVNRRFEEERPLPLFLLEFVEFDFLGLQVQSVESLNLQVLDYWYCLPCWDRRGPPPPGYGPAPAYWPPPPGAYATMASPPGGYPPPGGYLGCFATLSIDLSYVDSAKPGKSRSVRCISKAIRVRRRSTPTHPPTAPGLREDRNPGLGVDLARVAKGPAGGSLVGRQASRRTSE